MFNSTPNHNFTPRWTPLRPHPEQLRLWRSHARFKIVPGGRRSGKTELAKQSDLQLHMQIPSRNDGGKIGGAEHA